MSIARLLRVTRRRLRALVRTDSLDTELERELAFHFEQLVAEHMAEGLPRRSAEQAARRAMGNMPLVAEQCRDTRGLTWAHDLRQDLSFAWRTLAARPGMTAVITLSLALGIGANTAVLGVAHALLRDPLPIPGADRVVVLRTTNQTFPGLVTHATLDDYFAWAAQNRTLGAIGVGLGNNTDADADGDAPAERLQGQTTSAAAFAVLQVPPLLGRVLTDDDARRSTRAIVISHRLWQRRYAGDPRIVGRAIPLNGVPHEVVGVMPAGFHYPGHGVDYWVPFDPSAAVRTAERYFVVTARLAGGVTLAQARADLARVSARIRLSFPQYAGWDVRVLPVRDVMYGWTLRPLLSLGAAVALVLLVACTNIAGLLLARTLVREPEIALRLALGAGRGRVVRQLLTESLSMALLGGSLGLLVAWGGIRALVAMQPPPGALPVRGVAVDATILAVMACISIASGLLFGFAPAMMASGSRLGAALQRAAHDGRGGTRPRLREGLVALQIAVTFVLLVGAGLAAQSFLRLLSRDLRFDPARLLTFEITIPPREYMQPRGTVNGLRHFDIAPAPAATLERVAEAVRGVPGVDAVAGSSNPLLNALVPTMQMAVGPAGREETAVYFLVTPEFFTTLRVPFVSGRDFSHADREASPWVAIVNEAAARRFWPGEEAVGKMVRLITVPDDRPRTVIGLVRDIPLRVEALETRPIVYVSYLQQPGRYPLPGANQLGHMTFMVRTAGDPMALLPAVRRAVGAAAPGRALARVATVEQQIASFVPQRDELAFVLGAFALTAVLLAGIGIHGVMAHSVAQRTREIGIRMALGAESGDVIARVGRHALLMLAIGLVAGGATAVAATPLLRTLVWGISPTDPLTFGAAAALLLLVCAAAALVPARRAATVDPTVALRAE
jgi:predicted permease